MRTKFYVSICLLSIGLMLLSSVPEVRALNIAAVPGDGLYCEFDGSYNGNALHAESEYTLVSGNIYQMSETLSGALVGNIYYKVNVDTRIIYDSYSPQGMTLQNNSHDGGWVDPDSISVGGRVPISVDGSGDVSFLVENQVTITIMGSSLLCWDMHNVTYGHEYFFDVETGLCVRMSMSSGMWFFELTAYDDPNATGDDTSGDDDSSDSPFSVDGYALTIVLGIGIMFQLVYLKRKQKMR